MKESRYQAGLIKRIKSLIPDCVIMMNDPRQIQGVPDIMILHGNNWAMLEIKAHEDSPAQPNQYHYVELFGGMSYAAFIYPENEESVLDDLQRALGIIR